MKKGASWTYDTPSLSVGLPKSFLGSGEVVHG